MSAHPHFLHRLRLSSDWFASSAVVVAVTAAMTLAACGPRDETPIAGGAPGVTAAAAPTLATQAVPAADPALRPSGQPVPAMSGQPAAPVAGPAYAAAPQIAPTPAPAPMYAAAPVAAYPTDPAPQYRPVPVQAPVAPTPQPVASNRVGAITSIEPIRSRPKGSGAGAVIGGVLGAVVGNQFGHGLGRAAVTGAGAVGGALAGNNVERNYKEGVTGYRIVVRLDNGHTRTFDRTQVANLHVGDRVRLDANSFHRG